MSKPSDRQLKNAQAIADSKNSESRASKMDWHESISSLMRDLEQEGGPNISVAGLVSLVVGGLRTKAKTNTMEHSAEAIVSEIESTLDLVEMCQCLLHARKKEWPSWLRALGEVARSMPDDLRKMKDDVKLAIEQKKSFPLKFEIGLLAIEVHGASVEERKRNFAKYIVETHATWDWSNAPGGILEIFSGVRDVVPRRLWHILPTNIPVVTNRDAIQQFVEEIDLESETELDKNSEVTITEEVLLDWISKEPKWPDRESLWWMALQWLPWKQSEGLRTRSLGGKN